MNFFVMQVMYLSVKILVNVSLITYEDIFPGEKPRSKTEYLKVWTILLTG